MSEKPSVESANDANDEPDRAKKSPTKNNNQHGNLDQENKIGEISKCEAQREKRGFLDKGIRRGHGSKHPNGRQNKENLSRAEWR